jgi:hypothetical protein
MRTLLVLSGWPEARVPAAAWWSTDGEGRPFALSHGGEGPEPAPVGAKESGSVRVVLADGRELRAGIGARHRLSGADDAELVAHLYVRLPPPRLRHACALQQAAPGRATRALRVARPRA